MSTPNKLMEVKAQLTEWLNDGSLTTLVAVGKAQGMAFAGLYFAKHSGSTKHLAFFQNASERLAILRSKLS